MSDNAVLPSALFDEASLLTQAPGLIQTCQSQQDLLNSIIELGPAFLGCDASAVWCQVKGHNRWELTVSCGLSEKFKRNSTLKRSSNPPAPVEPMAYETIPDAPWSQHLRAEGISSAI